jgi:hypothetical protein
VAFANSADRGVAGHLSDVFGPEGNEPHTRTASRRGGRSLATGVTAANHQNIEHHDALRAFCHAGKIVSDD